MTKSIFNARVDNSDRYVIEAVFSNRPDTCIHREYTTDINRVNFVNGLKADVKRVSPVTLHVRKLRKGEKLKEVIDIYANQIKHALMDAYIHKK